MGEFVYPSIEGPTFNFLNAPCVAFEKYDGSNLRFFWDQQRGWHSTGTRYEGAFTRSFIEDVQEGRYPVLEGVVAKGVQTRRQRKGKTAQDVWMAKVKTRTWLDELARRSGESEDLRKEYEQNLREQSLPPETDTAGQPEEQAV